MDQGQEILEDMAFLMDPAGLALIDGYTDIREHANASLTNETVNRLQ